MSRGDSGGTLHRAATHSTWVTPADFKKAELLSAERRGYLQPSPWIVFSPGVALYVTVAGLNFVGDAVRAAFDPRTTG